MTVRENFHPARRNGQRAICRKSICLSWTKSSWKTAFLLAKSVFDAAHWQEIRLHIRIGTEEAWSTAVAAGMARATLCGMLAGLGRARQSDICIEPDFASQGLTAACRCIFFLRVGDIMFAAAKAAVKRRGKKE